MTAWQPSIACPAPTTFLWHAAWVWLGGTDRHRGDRGDGRTGFGQKHRDRMGRRDIPTWQRGRQTSCASLAAANCLCRHAVALCVYPHYLPNHPTPLPPSQLPFCMLCRWWQWAAPMPLACVPFPFLLACLCHAAASLSIYLAFLPCLFLAFSPAYHLPAAALACLPTNFPVALLPAIHFYGELLGRRRGWKRGN